jgi:hypothetical protein
MKRTFLALAVSAIALAGLQTPAAQASPAGPDDTAKPKAQCFRTTRMQKWTTDGDKVIYVRLDTGAVFQVTLANACPGLGLYQTIAFDTRFNDKVCDGERTTVISRSGIGPLSCPVSTVRALTREEAAALPDKTRP